MDITIDEEFIRKYAFSNKGVSNINNSQCVILGYTFNTMPKGWVYKEYKVSEKDAELFIKLSGIKGKNNQKQVIDRFSKGLFY